MPYLIIITIIHETPVPRGSASLVVLSTEQITIIFVTIRVIIITLHKTCPEAVHSRCPVEGSQSHQYCLHHYGRCYACYC